MQNKQYYIIGMLLFILLSACKKKEAVTDELSVDREAFIASIQGDWQVNEVRKDRALITDFSNFTLTIVDMTYSTTNGNPIWPISGSFSFENENAVNDLVRLDGRLFSANLIDGQLIIEISYTPDVRSRGETGVYEFTLE